MRTTDTHIGGRRRWWKCWGSLHCLPHRHRMNSATTSAPSAATPPPPPPLALAPPPPTSPASASQTHHLPPQPSSPSASSAADSVWAAVPPSSPASIPYTDAAPSPTAAFTLFPIRAPSVDGPSSPTPTAALGSSSAAILEPQRLLRPIFFDSVLVTPPLASTLTTEPTTPLSTAPFTPPPELAHLTTPPSPEVPFAQLLSPPRGIKSGPLPTLELVYRLCPGSPSAAPPSSSPPPPHPFSLFAADSAPRRIAQDPQCQLRLPHSRQDGGEEAERNGRMEAVEEGLMAAGWEEEGEGGAEKLMERSPVRALERFVERVVMSEEEGFCRGCNVLNSKCDELNEALMKAKERLEWIKKKEAGAGAGGGGGGGGAAGGGGDDNRENKFKQIIHWMQIEAKSQAQSIFRLSEELSWQETAFLDLQEQRLADLGIDLHGVNRELSPGTEVVS